MKSAQDAENVARDSSIGIDTAAERSYGIVKLILVYALGLIGC